MARSVVMFIAVLAFAVVPVRGLAQTIAIAPAKRDTPHERLSVGLVANFALEGSGPWFAPGFRLTVPFGRRAALDAESSAVFGGRTEYGSITRFTAVNLRLARESRQVDGTGRSWIVGLRHYPITGPGDARSSDVALTFGHGWDQVFDSGRRVTGEFGISGGSGILLFTTIAVTFPLHR